MNEYNSFKFNYSDSTHFGRGMSIWYPFLKNVNCIPHFEEVLQLGLFQTELSNVVNDVPHVSPWFFKFYLIFWKKNVTGPRVWYVALSVSRDIVNVTCQCHY